MAFSGDLVREVALLHSDELWLNYAQCPGDLAEVLEPHLLKVIAELDEPTLHWFCALSRMGALPGQRVGGVSMRRLWLSPIAQTEIAPSATYVFNGRVGKKGRVYRRPDHLRRLLLSNRLISEVFEEPAVQNVMRRLLGRQFHLRFLLLTVVVRIHEYSVRTRRANVANAG